MIFLDSILMISIGLKLNYSTHDLFFLFSGEEPCLDESTGESQTVRGERGQGQMKVRQQSGQYEVHPMVWMDFLPPRWMDFLQ